VHPGLLEQAGDALPHEDGVVGEHDPQAQVVDPARPPQGRELGRQPVGDDLEELLGLGEAGELVAAEIVHAAGGELRRARREEHLAPVSRRADPRGAVHVEPDEAVTLVHGHPRVEAHAHGHGCFARPVLRLEGALRRGRGLDGGLRRREDGEELVCAALDLASSVLRNGPAQERTRAREDVAVLAAKLAHEPGRPLDVGEEEGDLGLRWFRHA
jgi:hypothetical protein